MTAQGYQSCTDWLNHTPKRRQFFLFLFRRLPLVPAISYAGAVLFLFVTQHAVRFHFLLVPAVTFLAATFLRKALNFPRPYDQLAYTPFLPVHPGKGKSFPSRHSASAVAIALAFGAVNGWAGLAFGLIALAIGVCRVIGGAHFWRDVIAGWLFPLPFALLYLL